MSRRGTAEVRSLAGLRVTVMGLGLFGGGAGAARWALRQGARVTVTDQKSRDALGAVVQDLEAVRSPHPVHLSLGGHRKEDFEETDVLIVNPAVPPTSPWIQLARSKGAQITTATALLLERSPARVVAITGTHGKSSTASFARDLIASALGTPGRCMLGGNIGGSLLERLDDLSEHDVLVLELSSYQLEHLPQDVRSTIDVAAITNIGVDHLERHGTAARYRDAKLRLVALVREGGTAVLPHGPLADLARQETRARLVTHGADGDFRLDGAEALDLTGETAVRLADTSTLTLTGDFQRANLLVALTTGLLLGLRAEELSRGIPDLRGLSHRMESLGRFRAGGGSVEVIDNGVSTTPESTLSAVASVPTAGRSILVAGGQAKRGISLEPLARGLASRGDWIMVPFGASAAELARAAQQAGAAVDRGAACDSAEDAARRAMDIAARDGAQTVLFSPACASFDRYANFKERAMAFRGVLAGLAPGPPEAHRHPTPPDLRVEGLEESAPQGAPRDEPRRA